MISQCAPVAQGIEHRIPNPGAVGSNPAGGIQPFFHNFSKLHGKVSLSIDHSFPLFSPEVALWWTSSSPNGFFELKIEAANLAVESVLIFGMK